MGVDFDCFDRRRHDSDSVPVRIPTPVLIALTGVIPQVLHLWTSDTRAWGVVKSINILACFKHPSIVLSYGRKGLPRQFSVYLPVQGKGVLGAEAVSLSGLIGTLE